MIDPNQIIYVTPKPTYMVAYTGTLASGDFFQIPNRHRRSGDVADNPQVRIIIQAGGQLSAFASNALPYLMIYDVEMTQCGLIYVPTAWQLETDQIIRIAAGNFTNVSDGRYYMTAFYQMPK